MPVLATMTAIALLRGAGGSGPFFDPEAMRKMLKDGLEGESDAKLAQSLEIVDHLESRLARYRATVDKSADAYIESLSSHNTEIADLVAQLEPVDIERLELLKAIIAYRRQLIGILDDSSWAAVFE